MCVHDVSFYPSETLGISIKQRRANVTHNTCRYCIVSVFLGVEISGNIVILLVSGYIFF